MPYESLATRVAQFLLESQVWSADQTVVLKRQSSGEITGELKTLLTRGVEIKAAVVVRLASTGAEHQVWLGSGKQGAGPLTVGDWFRTDPAGQVRALPGFQGLTAQNQRGARIDSATANLGPSLSSRLTKSLKRAIGVVGPLNRLVRAVHRSLVKDPATDLSHLGGISWRIAAIDAEAGELRLEAYDRGGIWDRYLNAEGCFYPPQVPGNYYADALAAYVFAWMYKRTEREEFLDASWEALRFVDRVYPQYEPAAIVWHHSDFKNGPYVEALELLRGDNEISAQSDWAELGGLIGRFKEDRYSPTNVFAVRYHWRAAVAGTGYPSEDQAIEDCLERLSRDQTSEGLFHDNIPTYPDAHDLTYHQFTLACLAQGLSWQGHPLARDMFLKGVEFSLALTTPDGELPYVGRGANNVYHVASAILAFETAARMIRAETPNAGSLRRAARLLFDRLARFQESNGMLPTAMNPLAERRVGWNHCETPYNALVAALLLKSHMVADEEIAEHPIPMERPGYCTVLDESGYAAVRTPDLYAVVFGGCAPSYGWSEGAHRTGVAGLAQLGVPDRGPCLPILDQPSSSQTPPMTDLPFINREFPYGRGRLSALSGSPTAILLQHEYGGAQLDRIYLFEREIVVVVTRVTPQNGVAGLRIDGLIGAAIRRDAGWTATATEPNRYEIAGQGRRLEVGVLSGPGLARKRPRLTKSFTNPRGLASRLSLFDLTVAEPRTIHAAHYLRVGSSPSPSTAPVKLEHADDDHLVFRSPASVISVSLKAWPAIEIQVS